MYQFIFLYLTFSNNVWTFHLKKLNFLILGQTQKLCIIFQNVSNKIGIPTIFVQLPIFGGIICEDQRNSAKEV